MITSPEVKMDRFVWISVICFCCLSTTNAQFEDLEACLTKDFFAKFSSCVVDVILNDITLSRNVNVELVDEDVFEGRAVGRKLQSSDRYLSPSGGAAQYYVNMRLEQAGISDSKVLDDLKKLATLWSISRREDTLSDRIRKLNLRQMFGDGFLAMITDDLGQIMKVVTDLRDGHGIGDSTFLPELNRSLEEVVRCLKSFPESAYEDGLDWLQCFISCDALGPLWTCTTEMMTADSESCANVVWFADTLLAFTISLLNKTHCHFVVDDPADGLPIQLQEGGDEKTITLRSYLPPGVLCQGDPLTDPIPMGLAVVGHVFGFNVTCDVEMQLTTSNWIDNIVSPRSIKCREQLRLLRQVAIGYHDAAVNNSGVFKITPENWNKPFTIPLLPVVDHRLDGDVNVSFTMKMFVQGKLRGDTAKINVMVEDTDYSDTVECYALNDPHVMTFDGHYYNNFFHGAFYLYKHDLYPYEVQTIYQPCERDNKNATCTCAVAVRSGDDVFVVDRCRRCNGGQCDVSQLTVLYTNGVLTPGTRVFRMNGGLRHDIVLPHGTIVKIITSNNLLNVWIMPGSYDRNHTLGLCGTYNNDTTDDLMMPNNTVYTGPGNGLAEQPRDFNEAWRVPEDDLIFYGSRQMNDSFSPLDTCTCTHFLLAGAQCECGRGTLTDLCDLFMDNEYTSDNISSIIRHSLNNGSMPYYLSDIDMDEAYEPPDVPRLHGRWTEPEARKFCKDLIRNSNNNLIRQCFFLPSFPTLPDSDVEAIYEFCKQDIMILNSTIWKQATVDNAKFRCFNKLKRSDVSLIRLRSYVNSSCINNCHDNGECLEGLCMCDEGFYGPDCGSTVEPQPRLSQQTTQLCDNRHQLCEFASVFGRDLPDDGTMRCQIRTIEITPEGVAYLPKRYESIWEQTMSVISYDQAACPLAGNGSYEVYAVWDNRPVSRSRLGILDSAIQRFRRRVDDFTMDQTPSTDVKFTFISYDSACFMCDVITQTCQRKSSVDHCWIDHECWSPGQTKPDDPCRYCDPGVDAQDWIMSDETEECRNQTVKEQEADEERVQDMILRGAIGGSLSAVVIIVVIILYCLSKKKNKLEDYRQKMEAPMNESELSENWTFDNGGLIKEDNIYLTIDGTPKSSKHLTAAEVLASKEHHVTSDNSQSQHTSADHQDNQQSSL